MLRTAVSMEWEIADPEDRSIRNTISKLRKEGIIFIPVKCDYVGHRKYVRFDEATKAQRESFRKTERKKWLTTYFNTILPIDGELKDTRLHEIMGSLEC